MKLKILIVEDDLLLAEAVSDYFEGKGWETEQVHDGVTAVEKVVASAVTWAFHSSRAVM